MTDPGGNVLEPSVVYSGSPAAPAPEPADEAEPPSAGTDESSTVLESGETAGPGPSPREPGATELADAGAFDSDAQGEAIPPAGESGPPVPAADVSTVAETPAAPTPPTDAAEDEAGQDPPSPSIDPAAVEDLAPPATDEVAVVSDGSVDRPRPEATVDVAQIDDLSGRSAEPRTVHPLPRTVAIANQKGGVGKTTTAVNLSAALAEIGYRVLVVDLDPQGNATTGLGINPRNLAGSVYDVLMSDTPLEDCIEPTAVKNLFVVPATIDLAGAEIELVPAFSRELKLRRAIDSLAGEYDYIVIDCPPSLGLLTVNGLAAAGEVLVPIQCEYYALEGLGQLLKNIQLVQSNLNPRLELSTIVLTMYDARTKLADQVAREVREHFGSKVCRTIVPRTVRLSEAPSFGQPINVFDPASRGATAYRELAREVSGGEARRAG